MSSRFGWKTAKSRANFDRRKAKMNAARYPFPSLPYTRPYARRPYVRPPPRIVPEKKVKDVAGVTQANTTGTFSLLNGVAVGSDYTERVGRKTLNKSIYIRGRVQTEASLTAAVGAIPAQQARMIILVDNQPNAATPATTDLLNTATPESQLNLNNRDRFKILHDETFVFDPYLYSTTATQSYASTSKQIHDVKYHRFINEETIFNGNGGATIAGMSSGAIYMFWIGSEAAGATDINFTGSTRVRYNDA